MHFIQTTVFGMPYVRHGRTATTTAKYSAVCIQQKCFCPVTAKKRNLVEYKHALSIQMVFKLGRFGSLSFLFSRNYIDFCVCVCLRCATSELRAIISSVCAIDPDMALLLLLTGCCCCYLSVNRRFNCSDLCAVCA